MFRVRLPEGTQINVKPLNFTDMFDTQTIKAMNNGTAKRVSKVGPRIRKGPKECTMTSTHLDGRPWQAGD